MAKIRTTIAVEKETLEGLKKALEGTGLTVSSFTQVIWQGVVDSEEQPLKTMYETMIERFMHAAVGIDDKKDKRATSHKKKKR